MRKLDPATRQAVQAEINKHLADLRKVPGFVAAEPGFPLVDGRFRKEPAIIVLVSRKKSPDALLPEERLPRQLGEFPVAVMQADPWRQLEASASAQVMEIRGALSESDVDLTYTPPDGEPIDQVFSVETPMVCHVGPDAGWPVLKPFIEGASESLAVAMYDFNAEHVAKSFIDVIRGGVAASLTWDDSMTAPETEIRKKLRKLDLLDGAIVQCGKGKRFASAYHEKVAVRDHASFWLSSGNWSARSQPNIDPIGDPASAKGMFSKGNREWHVICQDAALAAVFEQYIQHDLDGSKQELEDGNPDVALDRFEPLQMPDVFVPIDELIADAVALAGWAEPTPPQSLPTTQRKYKVQPVLTPDNYLAHIQPLLAGAQNSLFFQFSYITWSDAAKDKPFREMLEILADKSYAPGFDLRIIVGNNSAADKIRKLVEAGFNESVFRVQSSVHNKGIIVDGKTVLVSSTNWSGDGVLRNRDAGLIIHDEEIASYFNDVFINDWENRASSLVADDPPVILASEDETVPPGMVRMAWREYFRE